MAGCLPCCLQNPVSLHPCSRSTASRYSTTGFRKRNFDSGTSSGSEREENSALRFLNTITSPRELYITCRKSFPKWWRFPAGNRGKPAGLPHHFGNYFGKYYKIRRGEPTRRFPPEVSLFVAQSPARPAELAGKPV